MLRQAIDRTIAWLFTKRDFQSVRDFLSRILRPLWPTYEFGKLPSSMVGYGRRGVAKVDGHCAWCLRKIDAALDINPGSGEAFFRARRVTNVLSGVTGSQNGGPVDLLCHVFPIRVRREPAMVLYCGAAPDLPAFVGELLPRFLALDQFDVPNDLLLLVNLRMGRQRFFQDALNDQIFRPRPIEIMRQFHLVGLHTLYVLSEPALHPAHLQRAAERFKMIYGPYDPLERPLFLCSGGARRAAMLARKYSTCVPDVFGKDYMLIDPARAPLKDVVRAVAGASHIAAPNTGEAAVLALARAQKRDFYEISAARAAHRLADRLLDVIGETRHRIRRIV
ncbi:hypothetical protein [Hyphomicrobium sp.]|jgi:hypothetical protein|uniref:hypothetical protein n=1 Tax=Hyphomicrobium sp. TaxID=82 RepID=UPI002BC07AE5|nr:hypothetical protein [Hyphomicrobium sp.]HVZ05379.1 hypothetical protein [Hyphomicrobium sp.]